MQPHIIKVGNRYINLSLVTDARDDTSTANGRESPAVTVWFGDKPGLELKGEQAEEVLFALNGLVDATDDTFALTDPGAGIFDQRPCSPGCKTPQGPRP